MDLKHPLFQSTLAGFTALGLYCTYAMLIGGSSEEETTEIIDKKQTITNVLSNLKKELKTKFKIEPSRDEDDGILSRDFMVKMHTILYQYKKYGSEMIADANFHQRIIYLKQADDLKENQADLINSKKMMDKYDLVLKGEQNDVDKFTI